jgi:hypothetical protein
VTTQAIAQTITVSGVQFLHGTNDTFEFYSAKSDGLTWDVCRFVKPDMAWFWQVFVYEPGDGRCCVLTSRMLGQSEGVLYRTAQKDEHQAFPGHLLRATAKLVKIGEIPEELEYDKNTGRTIRTKKEI